jgi:hypothetical protein
MHSSALAACIADLGQLRNPAQWHRTLDARSHALMRDPQTACDLTFLLGTQTPDDGSNEEHREAAAYVWCTLLDFARMDVENDGGSGRFYLSALEAEIGKLAASGDLTPMGAARLSQGYFTAGLEAPEVLAEAMAAAGPQVPPGGLDEVPAQITAVIDSLIEECRGEPYSLYHAAGEMTAMLPPDARPSAVGFILQHPSPDIRPLALYWCLDRTEEVRLMAAAILLERADGGRLSPPESVALREVRTWMPAGKSRDVVDRVLKAALRPAAQDEPASAPWQIEEILASLPDGVGAQGYSVMLKRARKRAMVQVLLKQGHGVKDCFMTVLSVRERKQVLESLKAEIDAAG